MLLLLESLLQPFLLMALVEIRTPKVFAKDWLQTAILLISAS
jgi:hypothetical protein